MSREGSHSGLRIANSIHPPMSTTAAPTRSPLNAPRACSGAKNEMQTNHADFGGTARTSAVRSPDRAALNGTRRTGRHEVAGLITQRSLVQIQPAQREKLQVAGLKGGSRAKGSRLDFCPTFAQVGGRGGLLPRQMGSTNHPSGGTRRTVQPTFSRYRSAAIPAKED